MQTQMEKLGYKNVFIGTVEGEPEETSCEAVIALTEVRDADGNLLYEECASPNDVPGYDKDQYMDPEVLAQSPSGSYIYKDADGNSYVSGFGLSY